VASRGDLSAECLKGRHRSPLYRFEGTTGTIIVRLVAYSSHRNDTGFAEQSRAMPAEPIARAPAPDFIAPQFVTLVDQPPTVINVCLRSSSTAIARPRGLRVAESACSPEAAWTGPLVSARSGKS